jgi:hypothetical protein
MISWLAVRANHEIGSKISRFLKTTFLGLALLRFDEPSP